MFTMISFHNDARDTTWNWKLGTEFPFDGAFPNNAHVRLVLDGKELEFVRQHFDGIRMARGVSSVVIGGEDARFIGSNMKFAVWENTSVILEQQLNDVRAAVTKYHNALDTRQHGGVAGTKLVEEVQDILGMPWMQGATLKKEG